MEGKRIVHLYLAVSCLLFAFLTACSQAGSASPSYAWIDVPINGLKIPINTVLQIEGHAANPDGIQHVELYV